MPLPWLTRVRINNYRSIGACDVTLSPLTLLIGPNGSGKSNFLDALRFLSDAIATSPYQAVEAHGGFSEILRRVPEPATALSIAVDVAVQYGHLPDQLVLGSYGLEIGRNSRRGERPLEVISEYCRLEFETEVEEFRTLYGQLRGSSIAGGSIERDRLYLPAASFQPNFAPLYGHLVGMAFYNLDATTLRQPQSEADGSALGHRGEHLPDVLGELSSDPLAKQRFDEYLAAAVPGVEGLDRQYAGNYVAVEMRQRTGAGNAEVTFGPDGMSDGTIRTAGVLAALFQPAVRSGQISLVSIEESELALHPAAAGVLFDALTEASEQVQVIASSQSADLLDRDDIDPAMIRAVTNRDGLTVIGELDDASQTILWAKQFTLGELMRGNQLAPQGTA